MLFRSRDASPVDYANVLGVVGGDIPDSQGHYPRRWKRAHGYKVTVSDDWMGDLLALSLAQISPALHSVYADLVTQSALLEASVEIARRDVDLRPKVIAALLDVSELHRRTFRDAVDQAISRIGEYAVPTLLVVAGAIAPNEDMRAHHEYAHFHLDRLDRLGP